MTNSEVGSSVSQPVFSRKAVDQAMKRTTSPAKAVKSGDAPYELKPKEQTAVDAHLERRKRAKPLPLQVVVTDKRGTNLKEDHPDPAVAASLTMEALGLTRVPEFTALLQHVVDLTQKDRNADEYGINQMLAQIAAFEPAGRHRGNARHPDGGHPPMQRSSSLGP